MDAGFDQFDRACQPDAAAAPGDPRDLSGKWVGHLLVLLVRWGHSDASCGLAANHRIKSVSAVMAAAQVTADFTPCQRQTDLIDQSISAVLLYNVSVQLKRARHDH
jgi:hypothetical protein